MRIHLGHHFYGAGNLGDDFMLAGFLSAMRRLAPGATFTCCVPFDREPLRRRFPEITWLPCEDAARERAVTESDVWLGLGGSPFQSGRSRWFVDHLAGEAAFCERAGRPMFFLGVGVQDAAEIDDPTVRRICGNAVRIWTRDPASAARLQSRGAARSVAAAADLAHLFFRDTPPPPAKAGRVTLVANFDYDAWPGRSACLAAIAGLRPAERVWLAQESRELPGAERALFATLPDSEKAGWRLVSPEQPGAPLPRVLDRWPSGEWLVTARYHATLAGAWAGSKTVVIAINEKLRAAAAELNAPIITPDADQDAVGRALAAIVSLPPPRAQADRAEAACAEFVRQGFRYAKT